MKKIVLLFLLLTLGAQLVANAQGQVTFIYLNGSNTNDQKMENWFIKGTDKFHPYLKKELEKDPLANEKMLKGMTINPTPQRVYWGDQSEAEIKAIREDIDFLNLRSPKTAQFARRFLSACLHDAIWASKYFNMQPILKMVHEEVKTAHENGDSVVLLGYSAGSFVAYQYIMNMLPVLSVKELEVLEDLENKKDYLAAINAVSPKNTCVEAIFRSKVVYNDILGALQVNDNLEYFKKNLNNLDSYTDTYCAPPGAVRGVVNYASPLILFYSEFSDPRYKYSKINGLLFKYIVENDLFFLTVNYSDDPMGFPTTKNITADEVEQKSNMTINPKLGLLFDKSDVSSHRTFLMAHTSYWSTGKRFAKIVTKAYREGHAHFYGK